MARCGGNQVNSKNSRKSTPSPLFLLIVFVVIVSVELYFIQALKTVSQDYSPNKKKYILIAPWSTKVLNQFRPKLTDYTVNKKTIAVPNDWKVDEKLLQQMVKVRLAE